MECVTVVVLAVVVFETGIVSLCLFADIEYFRNITLKCLEGDLTKVNLFRFRVSLADYEYGLAALRLFFF